MHCAPVARSHACCRNAAAFRIQKVFHMNVVLLAFRHRAYRFCCFAFSLYSAHYEVGLDSGQFRISHNCAGSGAWEYWVCDTSCMRSIP